LSGDDFSGGSAEIIEFVFTDFILQRRLRSFGSIAFRV